MARADNGTWAISTRGFNISTANKILVLIDGRTVYSPLFAGTFWSVQDVPLSDIDRIEVTRGPGGAIWGANAVNGVVNIITKSAAETQGVQMVLGAGTEERAIATVQYGGASRAFDYRVYGKFRARDGGFLAKGVDADDPVQYGQGGFRIESKGRSRDSWLIQGDAYGGREGLFDRPDTHVAGGNVMGRWGRALLAGREFPGAGLLRPRLSPRRRAGARRARHVRRRSAARSHRRPARRRARRRLSRVEGERHGQRGVPLRSGRRGERPSAGSSRRISGRSSDAADADRRIEIRAQHASRASRRSRASRLRWTPTGRQTVWGAVSRAVRLPTRFDTDLRFTNPATGAITLTGRRDFDTEKVTAYELGYRAEMCHARRSTSRRTRNVYDRLRSQEFPTRRRPAGPPEQPDEREDVGRGDRRHRC